MDVKLCNRVLNLKISDSKAGPQAYAQNRQIFTDYFSPLMGLVYVFSYDDY